MQNKLVFKDAAIEIHCERNDTATQMLANKLYPVHSNRIGTLFIVSKRKVPEVLKLFRNVDEHNIADAPPKIQQLYHEEMNIRTATEFLLKGHTQGNPVVNQHLTLRPHQQVARELAKVHDRFCFFYDTRTGKTPLSLAIINDDIQRHPDHKWLVVCPLILIENAWLEDANQFMPHIKTVNCHASTKAKRLKAMQTPANIYIANTESFATYKEHYEQMGFYGCIVDESSDMKSPSSKQSQALVEFSQTMQRWYLLSGSPAPNGEWEYYMQLQSIDRYIMPKSYTQFTQYYFVDLSRDPQYHRFHIRPDKKEELNDLLKTYCVYVDKEDVLTTPGRDFIEVTYPLPSVLKSAYREMKNKLYVELENERFITAPSAAAKLNKLNQITSGFVIDTQAVKENAFDDGIREEVHMLDDIRFHKLYELLDKHSGEQILIWANYRKEFEVIQKALGNKCACVYGATSLKDKTQAIQDFKNKKLQYLVANPASADKGLTLTNCHICIYFSLNWSYETYKQSMERIYADISKQPLRCIYYILIAEGTIDKVLYEEVLQEKAAASYAVLNHLKGDF